ncbi:MAG: polysaccharide deacetylase family protein [candidate division NC10 bacterium]|nr:polysaccharide deacetylase family protein [candidate division NC10 bacterium]
MGHVQPVEAKISRPGNRSVKWEYDRPVLSPNSTMTPSSPAQPVHNYGIAMRATPRSPGTDAAATVNPVISGWDEPAWQAFAAELDAWVSQGRQASLWWRDDDAGQPGPAFDRLLSFAADVALPLGLAVVPAWLAPEVAERIRAAPGPLVVLQHGFAHANHETEIQPGAPKLRPAECGSARPPQAVLEELAEGGARLQAAFGSRFLPVFVPPWNRIARAVFAGLPRLGYRALSAFGPRAVAEPVPGLLQVNCHADPIVWREGKRFAGASATLERLRAHLAARREGQADPSEPTGLLTHHRDMDPMFWAFLEELLGRLRSHPAVAFPPLPSLLDAQPVALG